MQSQGTEGMDTEKAFEAHVAPAPAQILEWHILISHCTQGLSVLAQQPQNRPCSSPHTLDPDHLHHVNYAGFLCSFVPLDCGQREKMPHYPKSETTSHHKHPILP